MVSASSKQQREVIINAETKRHKILISDVIICYFDCFVCILARICSR